MLRSAARPGSPAAGGSVLVTGASGGIGAELARAFASRGHDLVLVARDRTRLGAIARELTAEHGVKVTVFSADLSVAGAARTVFDALRKKRIQIDILVNNAGVEMEGDFATVSLDEHLRLLQINVVALTSLTHVFLEPMLQRRNGRILNVASIGGFMPVPRLSTYAAAKAFVLSLTEALSEELRGSGVTATALCPGITDTPMLRGSKLGQAIPSIMVMTAREVAEQGCAACLAGEAVCVPGIANSLFVRGAQLAPRQLVRAVGGLATSRKSNRDS